MSQANIDTLANRLGTGPTNLFRQWASKAWVNLNGVGTIAIRNSKNVSSITDLGTGTYQMNFSSSFAAVDYATSGGALNPSVAYAWVSPYSLVTSNVQLHCATSAAPGSIADCPLVSGIVHGDLA